MDIYSEKKAVKDLNSLYAEAVYGKPKSAGQELAKREKDDDAAGAPNKRPMVVTRADKKANTPAYQNYKKGDKRYTAADHLKNEEYGELYADVYNELQEKQKDTPDQVKAVIAFDKARKGTDDATYDSEHGKKKQAKKERDYAKWQRDKGAEDAQKSGHPWEHAKGSTREKEGKKSEKHAHIKDSYQLDKEALNLYHSIYNEEKPGAVAAALTKSTPKSQPDATPNKKVMGAKGETLQKNTANTVHTKVKEGFSSWRDDLIEYTNIVDEPESKADRKVKESKVKNKVIIDPEVKLEQALGGEVEVLEEKCKCDCGEVPCITCGGDHHAESKENKVKEEILWDRVAIALTELSEMNNVRFKVVAEHHERDADGNVIEHDEEIQEAEIGDILARLEKKRISKGGDPDDSPLPAMKKYHADKKKKKVKEDYWNEFEEGKVATGPRLGEPRAKGATHPNAGQGEKIAARTKKWMYDKGMKGAPGLDAMKARTAEHKAKRGVKEDYWDEFEEGYQREPDGGEAKERQRRREQKGGDRTEKVRGERTPMPPRGDKRREDFERWYAANVR